MKAKIFLVVSLILIATVLQIGVASAALCKGIDGYYHDCGYRIYDDHRTKQHLDYHYKDHVYEQQARYHYHKPTYYYPSQKTIKTYTYNTYRPILYRYKDRAHHVSYTRDYHNTHYKKYPSQYTYVRTHHADYSVYDDLRRGYYRTLYTYEPAYDAPTYYVYKGTQRHYRY